MKTNKPWICKCPGSKAGYWQIHHTGERTALYKHPEAEVRASGESLKQLKTKRTKQRLRVSTGKATRPTRDFSKAKTQCAREADANPEPNAWRWGWDRRYSLCLASMRPASDLQNMNQKQDKIMMGSVDITKSATT